MLAPSMTSHRSRIASAVIVVTTLVAVVAVAGNGLQRATSEPERPSVPQLREIGVITSEFPVPGALPPEVYPAEAWGLAAPIVPGWLLWLLAALGVAVVVAVGRRILRELRSWRRPRRRRTRPTPEEFVLAANALEQAPEAQLARRAVDAALVPLREPADPRTAVIEAYARMEQVLAEQQLGRRAPEAPREYLRRLLREQGMPDEPLTRLTALFEEARFSRHPIPGSAPRRAALDLESVRAAAAQL
jgi:hypothetical protein